MGSLMSTDESIDRLLLYCHRHRISLDPRGESITIDQFQFRVSPHSTGNSVGGYIRTPDGLYEFLNGTFWFSSCYLFNAFKWEAGAWDAALSLAFSKLRILVENHKEQTRLKAQAKREEEALLEQLAKREVEKQFTRDAIA